MKKKWIYIYASLLLLTSFVGYTSQVKAYEGEATVRFTIDSSDSGGGGGTGSTSSSDSNTTDTTATSDTDSSSSTGNQGSNGEGSSNESNGNQLPNDTGKQLPNTTSTGKKILPSTGGSELGVNQWLGVALLLGLFITKYRKERGEVQ